MKMLWWFIIDALRYAFAASAWHLTSIFGLLSCFNKQNQINRFGRFVFPLIGDWAYWDDPWVQYQRWTKRGYDMEWMLK
jgi:hypothetical protein